MIRRRLRGKADTAPTPTVTSVSPSVGPASGGDTLTITGTGFRSPGLQFSVTWVGVGSSVATSVTVVSATSLTCVTPASSGPGSVTVAVGGTGGVGRLATGFTYGGLTTESGVLLTTESGVALTTEA